MADTTFVDQVTVIPVEWGNDVNDAVHTGLGITVGSGQINRVRFPATQVSSANANDLDDYEEGTWTPAVSFATPGDLSVTYANQLGHYTKIGRQVFVNFLIVTSAFTHTTASGDVQITGLPFASTAGYRGGILWQGITKANYTDAVSLTSSSLMNVQMSGSGQTRDTAKAADMPSGGTVFFGGTVGYA